MDFCSFKRSYGKLTYFYNICSSLFYISVRISTLRASSWPPWPNWGCGKSRAALLLFMKVHLVNTEMNSAPQAGSEHSVIYFTRMLCSLLILLQPLHCAFETAVKVLLRTCTFFVREPFWHFHFTHLTSWSAAFSDLLNWQFCFLKHWVCFYPSICRGIYMTVPRFTSDCADKLVAESI